MAINTNRGRIELEYHIICGACGYWDFIDVKKPLSKEQLEYWAKTEEWIMTRKFGWTCPSCQRALKRFEKKHLTGDEK